jgi:hypothetical protein
MVSDAEQDERAFMSSAADDMRDPVMLQIAPDVAFPHFARRLLASANELLRPVPRRFERFRFVL